MSHSIAVTPHLYCASCGLHVMVDTAFLATDNCPRCRAHHAILAPLAFTTSRFGAAPADLPACAARDTATATP